MQSTRNSSSNKSRETSFDQNWFFAYPIVLKFVKSRAEHSPNDVVLCANFENDCSIRMDVTDEEISRDLSLKSYCSVEGY